MNNEQIKQFVAERVARGINLSAIQDELTGNGVKITFMELRLIASEIDTAELEKLVNQGSHAVTFSLHAVTLDQLMAIADAGAIMPPKSTWFEPKLRSGLVVHTV